QSDEIGDEPAARLQTIGDELEDWPELTSGAAEKDRGWRLLLPQAIGGLGRHDADVVCLKSCSIDLHKLDLRRRRLNGNHFRAGECPRQLDGNSPQARTDIPDGTTAGVAKPANDQ